jgi:hypothetical protein
MIDKRKAFPLMLANMLVSRVYSYEMLDQLIPKKTRKKKKTKMLDHEDISIYKRD